MMNGRMTRIRAQAGLDDRIGAPQGWIQDDGCLPLVMISTKRTLHDGPGKKALQVHAKVVALTCQ
jgi:hypothetical protein